MSTTASTTFQTKISDTTSNLPIGLYKITISYMWNHSSTSNDFEAQFTFDGSPLGQNSGVIHKEEPKDTGGDFSGTGSAQNLSYTQIFYVNVGVSGTKSVLLEYRTDSVGANSSIWDASVEILRVS